MDGRRQRVLGHEMPDTRSEHSGILGVLLLTLILAVGLGEIYVFTIARMKVSPWIGVLTAHAVLSVIIFLIRKPVRVSLKLRGGPLLPWLAGPLVLLGAYLLAVLSERDGVPYAPRGSSEIIYAVATLTVIPLVEEIVFRGGVSPFLSRFTGPWISVWLAAIVFSMAHTSPTWNRLIVLKVGLPFGPFLLGLCCDMIVRRWGRLWPAVLFHASCNGTVYIFSTINPTWLRHFGGLYM